ncbi:MAG: class I SAM-dependent methyltransferase [Sulfitobacter sp.]
MTLHDHIIARIQADGPMRLDDYMTTCLLHPTMGYYTTQQVFGQTGDFTTAPEISQMFGELLGLCLAQTWLTNGAPTAFTLAELGPGRGTLMADALRACRGVPGFLDAAHIVLVEASPAQQDHQRATLKGYDVTWVNSTAQLPDAPLYLIANEFFDALPIRQFVRAGPHWSERQIGVETGALHIGLGPALPQPSLAHRMGDTRDDDLVEVCATASVMMGDIARRIDSFGGAALIVDYGDWRSLGDTFQALMDHKIVDPLTAPGQADLTAHVDFEALALAAVPAAYSKLTPQGVFLERLGITERAQKLAVTLTDATLYSHVAAHRRLTHPAEMGNLFKVLGLYQNGKTPPPGLQP